jgi:large subunit ribosomal protein L30
MAKIKVKQIASTIDRPKQQKLVIEALGLGKISKVREHNDTPQIRGMINKVKHLVEVTNS